MTGDAAREVLGRVVKQEKVEAAVLVVIEKDGVGGESGVGDAISSSRLGEGAVLVVDEEEVGAVFRLRPLWTGDGDIDVEVAVVVDVHHGGASCPALGRNAGFLGDVLEVHSAFVQVQAARHHVAGEEDVGQSIIVDVAHSDSSTIVDVDVGLDVQRIAGGDGVGELDAGFIRAQKLEQRSFPFFRGATRQQKKNYEGEIPRRVHACETRGIFSS